MPAASFASSGADPSFASAEQAAQLAPRAEEQRLNGRLGHAERQRELVVGEAGELPQQERPPLLERQPREREPKRFHVTRLRRPERRIAPLGFRNDLRQRLAHPSLHAGAALVARDRGEPRCRLARLGAPKQVGVGGEKCLLRRVLGLVRIAEHAPADTEHERRVRLEELGKELVSLSGEFKTASDVNHFLGKLLLLIAQDRIPHRNAVAMAYICQLLLCTLDSVRHEITNEGPGFSAWKAMVAKALSSRLPQQS